MFSSIGPIEVIIVLAVALMVIGPKRLPDTGKSIGRGLREFKAAIGSDHDADITSHDLAAPPESRAPSHATDRAE